MDECGTCHSEALTDHDRQVVRDFERFLGLTEYARTNQRWEFQLEGDNWRWIAYMDGDMGAPPLLWEGDNA